MGKRTVYHVTKGEDWRIAKAGADRASATAETKAEAIQRAVELAKNTGRLAQVRIHRQDGTIQSERTYGKDPEKYPG
jgi:2-oxo-4-hydroxy-4-carboxy--5-ureidoimidazoline (OHCU) decarboxylase